MSDTSWQPDPEYADYLREMQEPLNENEVFEKRYGFEHNCHCAEDYEEGKIAMVSECWANMCDQALETCATLKAERDELKIRLASLEAEMAAA